MGMSQVRTGNNERRDGGLLTGMTMTMLMGEESYASRLLPSCRACARASLFLARSPSLAPARSAVSVCGWTLCYFSRPSKRPCTPTTAGDGNEWLMIDRWDPIKSLLLFLDGLASECAPPLGPPSSVGTLLRPTARPIGSCSSRTRTFDGSYGGPQSYMPTYMVASHSTPTRRGLSVCLAAAAARKPQGLARMKKSYLRAREPASRHLYREASIRASSPGYFIINMSIHVRSWAKWEVLASFGLARGRRVPSIYFI